MEQDESHVLILEGYSNICIAYLFYYYYFICLNQHYYKYVYFKLLC